MTISWLAFYFLFPVLALFLAGRFTFFKRLSAVLLCYLVGLLAGNIHNIFGFTYNNLASLKNLQEYLFIFSIALALPLLFFSVNIKKWFFTSGKPMLSFGLQVIAVIIAVVTGFIIFRNYLGMETWKISGMLIGVYTGGTVNLASIGVALNTDKTLIASLQLSDMAISAIYILIIFTVLKPLLLRFLKPYRKVESVLYVNELPEYASYGGMFKKQNIGKLGGAFALALAIVCCGVGVALILPEDFALIAAVLIVCTLGIVFSLIPAIRKIPMTYQLGQYFILIFCLVVASMADIREFLTVTPVIIIYVTWAVFVSLILHSVLAYFFKVDADTVIVTSAAGILSPPFIPMVAEAIKNRELIVSGIMTGILGWVIGTYLGIGVSLLVKLF
jgi:uncharacterized membrane protein